jgi:hypothetical protein
MCELLQHLHESASAPTQRPRLVMDDVKVPLYAQPSDANGLQTPG